MDNDIEELDLTVIHLQPQLDSGEFHAPVLVLGSMLNLAKRNISQNTYSPFKTRQYSRDFK